MDTFQKQLSSNTPHTIPICKVLSFSQRCPPQQDKTVRTAENTLLCHSIPPFRTVCSLSPSRSLHFMLWVHARSWIHILPTGPSLHTFSPPSPAPSFCVRLWMGSCGEQSFREGFPVSSNNANFVIDFHPSTRQSTRQPASMVPRFDFFCVTSENRIKCCLLLAEHLSYRKSQIFDFSVV